MYTRIINVGSNKEIAVRKYFYCLRAKDGTTIGQVIYFGELDDSTIRAEATELLFKDHPEASPKEYELHVRSEVLTRT